MEITNLDKIEETASDESNTYDNDLFEQEESVADCEYDTNWWRELKIYFRYFRKKISAYRREHVEKRLPTVLYLTADCPGYTPFSEKIDSPIYYINAFRNQYPNYNIAVMVPLLNVSYDIKLSKKITVEIDGKDLTAEKIGHHSEYFYKNKIYSCYVYKFSQNTYNIPVYGIYSETFSHLKDVKRIKDFEYIIPYLSAVRTVLDKSINEHLMPDIVHSDRIPYFLGAEFEHKPKRNIKVFQTVDDFIYQEYIKQSPFNTIIHLADKKVTDRILTDNVIKKNFARLFSIPIKNIAPVMSDCLDIVYKNYEKFSNSPNTDKNDNIIFRELDLRVKKLFPNLFSKESTKFYQISNSIKKCNKWAVYSKTYYKNLFEKTELPEEIAKLSVNDIDKSDYISAGIQSSDFPREEGRLVYRNFGINNFREYRVKNKETLIREFSHDKIKTDFIDKTLFKSNNVKIYGYLDSFYKAPLLFANPAGDIFGEGIDILINTITRLFELNKNIQVILCINNGLQIESVRQYINFLVETSFFSGRWVFIDGNIDCGEDNSSNDVLKGVLNLPKFFAGADMYLAPARLNDVNLKYLLGMHYGCIPVVSNCGMMGDGVVNVFDDISGGNGFKTSEPLLRETANGNIYLTTLLKALDMYNNNSAGFNIPVKNAMSVDIDWTFKKLAKFNKIYQELL